MPQIDVEKMLKAKVAQGKAKDYSAITPAEKAQQNPRSLRAAINAKCHDCVCFQKREVTRCVMTDCPLWKLRPWQNKQINQKILSGEMR